MEKVMSIEEKIKKAEEIYYRRNPKIPIRENSIRSEKTKKDIKLIKKMIKQIIICMLIYIASYIIINNNYIFSADFTQKAKQILSQDIDFSKIYSYILTTFNLDNKLEEKVEMTEKNIQEIQNNDENIGGAEDFSTIQETNVENNIKTEETPILSQMEQDTNYIKDKINFIKPVNGKISSMFGLRNPTTSSVPKNHTGTDIAAEIGTKIVSATDGIVILSSSKGDYGNHLKIQINDVIILYAHCNKLYVKEGDVIQQGQEIAEVGKTGNTTGPHLHFEIRYQDRYIDPQLVLEL